MDCFTSIVKFTGYLWLFLTRKFHLEISVTKKTFDTRNKFERFWSSSIRPLWSILRLKLSPQAHWFNELECWTKTKTLLLLLKVLLNNCILKELTVDGKNFKTLFFKAPKKLLDYSITQRRPINLLTRILGIDWISGFYPYSVINEYFFCLRVRFPKLTVFWQSC